MKNFQIELISVFGKNAFNMQKSLKFEIRALPCGQFNPVGLWRLLSQSCLWIGSKRLVPNNFRNWLQSLIDFLADASDFRGWQTEAKPKMEIILKINWYNVNTIG